MILEGLRGARLRADWAEFDAWVVLAGKFPSPAFTPEL
jgi:hypothetical protein